MLTVAVNADGRRVGGGQVARAAADGAGQVGVADRVAGGADWQVTHPPVHSRSSAPLGHSALQLRTAANGTHVTAASPQSNCDPVHRPGTRLEP